jgi:methyl-accepting chemotaxis protein
MSMTIRHKLLATVAVLCLALLTVAGFALRARLQLDRELNNATRNLVPSSIALGKLSTSLTSAAAWTRAALVDAQDKAMDRVAEARGRRDRAVAQAESARQAYGALPMSDEEVRLLADFDAQFQTWHSNNDAIWAALSAGDGPRARELANANMLVNQKTMDASWALLETQAKLASASQAHADEVSAAANATLIASVLASAVLAGLVAAYLARAISKPLAELGAVAGKIALGEIDHEIVHRSEDELGQLADAFRGSIAYLREAAEAAEALRRGDLGRTITPRSERDALSKSFLAATQALSTMLDAELGLIESAKAGDLHHRAETRGLEGAYRQAVESANALVEAFATPVKELRDALDRAAARDLGARMIGSYTGEYDAMKRSLNAALANIDEGLSQVALASEQVGTAVVQISHSAQAVASGASEQASALEETSASLEEMAGATKRNAENASAANRLAQSAEASSSGGVGSMRQMREAMEKIRGAADGTAAIIKDINEIAFQTNLLALNAAVEAARAGDAGRGFAVVAEEVRNLALRCKEAARKTEQLIVQSVQLARDGEATSKEVGQSLEQIASSITQVSTIVADIAQASEEQARGIEQVNRAVAQMDQVTQQNAANSEESASAAEELSAQAQELAGLVAQFQLSDGSGRRSPSRPKGPALVARVSHAHDALARPAAHKAPHVDLRALGAHPTGHLRA